MKSTVSTRDRLQGVSVQENSRNLSKFFFCLSITEGSKKGTHFSRKILEAPTNPISSLVCLFEKLQNAVFVQTAECSLYVLYYFVIVFYTILIGSASFWKQKTHVWDKSCSKTDVYLLWILSFLVPPYFTCRFIKLPSPWPRSPINMI